MLRAENLELSVPGKMLCRDLSITIQPGQCWGILGQNGSGKTTLLHALSGLAAPRRGSVMLHQRPIEEYARRELALRIGLLPQDEEHAFWGTVLEYVLLGRFPHARGFGVSSEDEEAALAALRRVGLEAMAERIFSTLSGGEQQRVRIAMLLAQAPDIYCLDEPLRHLDLRRQAEVMRLFGELAGGGKTVLLVLHETLWASRYCDHVLLLYDGGRAMAGEAAGLLTRRNLEELYQCPLREVTSEHGSYYLPE